MSAAFLPRTSFILAGLLLLATGPVLGQPDEAKKPEADKHVDHEGFPLPAEAIARVGSARFRSDLDPCQLAYSPDGKQILSATKSRLEYWDAATGKLLRTVPLTAAPYQRGAVEFQPDGKLLVFDGKATYECLDVQSGKTVWTKQLKPAAVLNRDEFMSVRFSPKTNLIALRDKEDHVRIFELSDGKERLGINLDLGADGDNLLGRSLAFTPDQKLLLVMTAKKMLDAFDVATGEKRLRVELPAEYSHIELSPDGRDLICTGWDRTLVRDWAGKRKITDLGRPVSGGYVYRPAAAFSPDGRWLAIADGPRSVSLFDAATGKEVFKVPAVASTHLAFSHDSKRLVADAPIRQWDVPTGKLLSASADPLMWVRGFVDNGKQLLIQADSYSVVDWKIGKTVEQFAKAAGAMHAPVAFSHEGGYLAYIQNLKDRDLLVVDAPTGKELRRFSDQETRAADYCFAGKRLVTAGKDNVIRVWDLRQAKPIRELQVPPANLSFSMAASADGRLLVVNCFAEDTQVWDLNSGKRLMSLNGRGKDTLAPGFSPDTSLLVRVLVLSYAPRQYEVALVDMSTGKEKRVIHMTTVGHGINTYLSADNRTLAVAHTDPFGLRLWEVASAKERHRFEGHKQGIASMAFAPDGTLLAASSYDAPIFIWDVYGKHAAKPQPPEKWSDDDEKRLLETITGDDAVAAFQTIRRLIRNPGPAVSLLAKRITPAAPIDAKRVARSIAALDSDDFAERDRAYAELEKNADGIQGAVETALKNKPALETKRRLESLLVKAENATPEYLRQTRALEALEQIATPDAVRLLQSLAKGEPAARLTREARESLERIRKR